MTVKSLVTDTLLNSFTSPRFLPPASAMGSKSLSTSRFCRATLKTRWPGDRSSGSAKYPIDLLKDAGVDMTTSQPFDAAMREMNRIMDEMERIYAHQKG